MPNEFVARNGVIALNNSTVTGSLTVTNGITGSLFGTSSLALTASSAENFLVRQSVTASNALITGTITAQTLVVSTVSSSVVYSSGSNIFGNELTNVQQFTGSLRVTGSGDHWIVGGNVGIGTTNPASTLSVNGDIRILGGNSINFNRPDNGAAGNILLNSNNNIVATSALGGTISLGTDAIFSNNVSASSFIKSGGTSAQILAADGTVITAGTNISISGGTISSTGGSSASGDKISSGSVTASVDIGAATFRVISGSSTFVYVSSSGNIGIGTTTPSLAKLQVSGSSNVVNFRGSGSATTSSIFTVDGASGRLFTVNDSLSGSLFSVNTIAGLPVIEAFSDNTVRMGQYGQRALFVSQSRVGIGKESPLNATLDISGSLAVSGTFTVSSASNIEFQVLGTGVKIGSAISDIHTVTGSLNISGSTIITGSTSISGSLLYSVLQPTTIATASAVTLTPNISSADVFTIISQSSALSVANPTGTPVNGQKIIIRIKDNSGAQSITWSGTQYRASTDLTLPTTTIANKTMYLGFIYNSNDTKWDLLAYLNNF